MSRPPPSDISLFINSAARGDIKKVLDYLNSGIDIDALDSGLNALTRAAFNGETDVVELLVMRGADIHATTESGNSVLHYACRISDQKGKMVKLLLQQKAETDIKGSYGQTPLMTAVQYHNLSAVKLLLDHQADIDIRDNFEKTAVDYAKEMNFIDIIKVLEDAENSAKKRSSHDENPDKNPDKNSDENPNENPDKTEGAKPKPRNR